MAGSVGSLKIELRASLAKLETDLKKANQTFKQFGASVASSIKSGNLNQVFAKIGFEIEKLPKKIKKFDKELGKIGASLDKVVIPLVSIGALAVKAAVDFESAFAEVADSVKGSDEEIEKLRKGILSLSRELPTSAEELAHIADEAGKLGVGAADVEEFTKTISQFGTASGIATDEVIESFGALVRATHLPIDSLDNLGSAILGLTDLTGASEEDIVSLTNKLATVGSAAGLSVSDIAAFSASIAALNLQASGGDRAFVKLTKTLMDTVAIGGTNLQILSQVVGQDFKKAFESDAAGAVAKFLEGLNQLGDNQAHGVLEKLGLGADKTSLALLTLASSSVDVNKNLGASQKYWADNTVLVAAANEKYDTMANRLKVTWNNVKALGIVIGSELFPVLEAVLELINQGVDWVLNFDKTTVQLAITLAGLPILLRLVVGALQLMGRWLLLIPGLLSPLSLAFTLSAFVFIKWRKEVEFVFRSVVATVAQSVANILRYIKNLVDTLDNMTKDFRDKFTRGWGKIRNFFGMEQVAEAVEESGSALDFIARKYESVVREQGKLAAELGAQIQQQAKENAEGLDSQTEKTESLGEELARLIAKNKNLGEIQEDTVDRGLLGTDKSIDKLKSLRQEWADLNREVELNSLREALRKAAESGDANLFKTLQLKLTEALTRGTIEGLEDGANSQAVRDQIFKNAEFRAQTEADAVLEAQLEVNKQIAEDEVERRKQAAEESVNFWANMMENAITGETFNLKDSLKQVAIGFSSQMASAITGGFGAGIGDMKGLGELFARQLTGGEGSGGFLSGIGDMIGSLFGTSSGGAMGPLTQMESGLQSITGLSSSFILSMESMAAAMGPAAAISVNMKNLSKLGKSTAGTIEGAAAGIGTAIGAIFGGPAGAGIGAILGDFAGKGINAIFGFGKIHPEQAARHTVEQWMEALLEEATKQGRNFLGLENIIFGSADRFSAPGWADQFAELAGPDTATFDAMGEGLRLLAGVTEEVGGQIGYILAVNLNGNLDKARLLMQSLGIGAQEMEDAIVQAGKMGQKSWHEVEVALQGLNGLTGEGLVAVGNLRGAFDQLVESGGRGSIALQAVRNIAIEAMEAGAKTLEELEAKLKATGEFTESEIRALMDALRQRGINSMEDLSGASERTLGGIVADLESAGVQWKEMAEDVQTLSDNLEGLDEKLEDIDGTEVGVTVKVEYEEHNKPSELEGEITPFARGGVVTRPTLFAANGALGLMGEAGPEAILPLKRVNGKLGVLAAGDGRMSAPVIHIDARGAAPGVENDIRNALLLVKEQAVNEALYKMRDMQRRN